MYDLQLNMPEWKITLQAKSLIQCRLRLSIVCEVLVFEVIVNFIDPGSVN